MPYDTKTLIVTGPTATGKTRLAVELARLFNGEIISADSRQVYRGLDLGTGKDLEEYGTPPRQIRAHLIDVADPDEDFHLLRFLQLAEQAMEDIAGRGKLPIIAGGTPLYINALLNGYDMPGEPPNPRIRRRLETLTDQQLIAIFRKHASPELLQRADLTQRKRILRATEIALTAHHDQDNQRKPLQNTLIIAPYYTREQVRERIRLRLDERFQQGMLDEIRELQNNGVTWERLEWFGLEYRHIAQHLQGKASFQEMHDQLLQHIRKFAKAQDIWFRKFERENHPIHWIPEGNLTQAEKLVGTWLSGNTVPQPDIVLNTIHYGPKRNN